MQFLFLASASPEYQLQFAEPVILALALVLGHECHLNLLLELESNSKRLQQRQRIKATGGFPAFPELLSMGELMRLSSWGCNFP